MRNGLLGALAIFLIGPAQLFAQTPFVAIDRSENPPPSNLIQVSAQDAGLFPGMGVSFGGSVRELGIEDSAGHDFLPTGSRTLEVLAGYYHGVGKGVPRYDFVPVVVRFGLITSCGQPDGCRRGNFEPLLEISGAPATTGPGSFYAGASFHLRYNFVQPECRLVPYVQIGAGITYNDGFRDPNQRALGNDIEFLLHAQVGARYFIRDNLALNVEAGYIHISNAGLSERNRGINAFGISAGVTYFLGGPRMAHRCW